jgi:hypothetical protein
VVWLTRHSEKEKEPLVKVCQFTLAKFLRNLDEPEERQQHAQRGHEHSGLLPAKPSCPGQNGTASILRRAPQAATASPL